MAGGGEVAISPSLACESSFFIAALRAVSSCWI